MIFSRFPDAMQLNNFKLPVVLKKDSDYVPELELILKQYEDYIAMVVNIEPSIIDSVKANISLLKKAVRSYFNADIQTAQGYILNILEKYKDNSFIVSNIDNNYAFRGLMQGRLFKPTFYRARTGECDYTHDQMFHIPFDMRERISSQRFSIPGIPCLYLGTTSYVCWLELGKPNDRDFNVSAVNVDSSCKILNLVISESLINGTSTMVKSEYPNYKSIDQLKALIEFWPLVCATSFKINDNKRNFKSEYIVFQLITQNLKHLNIDGVAYTSKHVIDYSGFPQCINLALPMWYSGDFTFTQQNSKLYIDKEFEITDSINLSEFMKVPKDNIIEETRGKISFVNNYFSNTNSYTSTVKLCASNTYYFNTDFAKLDNFLLSRSLRSVRIDDNDKPYIQKYNNWALYLKQNPYQLDKMIYDIAVDLEKKCFRDLTFQSETVLDELKSKDNACSGILSDLPYELTSIERSYYRFEHVSFLPNDALGFTDHNDRLISINGGFNIEGRAIAHEMLHVYTQLIHQLLPTLEGLLISYLSRIIEVKISEWKINNDSLKDLETLKAEIFYSLDSTDINNLGETHSMLFFIKSIDLDLVFELPFGTTFLNCPTQV